MLRATKRFALLYALWLVLTAAEAAALLPGLVAAAAAALLARGLTRESDSALPLAPLVRLFPGFLWRGILAGIDVALRALRPEVPVAPGWIRHPTRLPDGMARVVFGSTLSLTPGSLAAGSEGGMLLVHCLDTRGDPAALIAAEEDRLARAGVDG